VRAGDARRAEVAAALALLLVTAIWGSTFFLIKDVVARMDVPDFLAVRFAVAAAVMALVLGRPARAQTVVQRRRGLALGACYGAAQLLQTWGLDRTAASVAGFVTGMYVVLTPVVALAVLRQRTPRSVWVAVALATAGMAVLSLRGFAVGTGEALILASAVLYAVHIVGLGAWSLPGQALGTAVWQMLAIATCCVVAALPGGLSLPPDAGAWWGVLYTAVAAGAAALLLQTWAQAHLAAARAAVIMAMEPVFAALFAVLLGGERLGMRVVVGGPLVLTAMLVSELVPRPVGSAAQHPPIEALHHEP
jgi:drug/metabolite transporter (DMT)-like permease